jgi:hypothetical protein
MYVRIQLAPSFERFFGAPSLWSGEQESLPAIGDSYDNHNARFRVVKVMLDVDPECGSQHRGPVVFVVKIDPNHAHVDGSMRALVNASFFANVSGGLRDCIERADAARRQRNSELYRKHIEEFLFLSHAASRLMGPGRTGDAKPILPYLPMYGATNGLTRVLRDGLIDHSFGAQVMPVISLQTLRSILDRVDVMRPTVVIITEPIILQTGLTAISVIRKHPNTEACPVLVLTQPGRIHDGILAMGAGATDVLGFPSTKEDYVVVVSHLRAILAQAWQVEPSAQYREMRL